MPFVHMLIGIQGSGKTTFARILHDKYQYPIVSTDVVRMNHPDWKENLVWPEVFLLCANFLKAGHDVIFDATNITPKVRKRFIDEVKKYDVDFEMKAYFFKTPLNTCIERVKVRNEQENELFLPLEVIASYANNIIEPSLDEGFQEIIIMNEERSKV